MTSELFEQLHDDLSRPHPFAFERVAFLSCKTAHLAGGGTVLLAHSAHVPISRTGQLSLAMIRQQG